MNRLITFAALFFLPWSAPAYELALYKNGQVVQTFPLPLAKSGVASDPVGERFIVPPELAKEERARQDTVTSFADEAIRLRRTTDNFSDPAIFVGPGGAATLDTLESALNEMQTTLAALTARMEELDLDQTAWERHSAHVTSFQNGFASFQKIRAALEEGNESALEDLRDLLAPIGYGEESDLGEKAPALRVLPPAIASAKGKEDPVLFFGPEIAHKSSAGGEGEPPAHVPANPADLLATPDVIIDQTINEMAADLGHDPIRIYEFVRNEVRFQSYRGSRKGSLMTLEQREGNDADQASLLIALLRASNIPARYAFGEIEMTVEQAMNWLGVNNGFSAGSILTSGDLGGFVLTDGPNPVAVRSDRIWVEACVPYSNYRGLVTDNSGLAWVPLDPAFTGSKIQAGTDIVTQMGLDIQTFLVDHRSTFNAIGPVAKLENDIQTWLDANQPGATIADVEYRAENDSLKLGLLPSSLPYQLYRFDGRTSSLTDNDRFRTRFVLFDADHTYIDHTVRLVDLVSDAFHIDYVGATPADQATIDSFGGIYRTPPHLVSLKHQLRLGDAVLVTSTIPIGMGERFQSDMVFLQPSGATNSVPVVSGLAVAGNTHAVAFDTYLDKRTDDFLNFGFGTDSTIVESSLHPLAREWLHLFNDGTKRVNALLRLVSPHDVSEAIVKSSVAVARGFGGTPLTFEWNGLIVDADRRIAASYYNDGPDPERIYDFALLAGHDGSFMENQVFEGMFNQAAVSTIRVLQMSDDMGIDVCTITTSISADCPGFNHSTRVRDAVNAALASGKHVIIPKEPITAGQWSGTGYIRLDPSDGSAAYIIAGGIGEEIVAGGGATIEEWPFEPDCWPKPGTLTAEVLSPESDTPHEDGVFWADDKPVKVRMKLNFICSTDESEVQESFVETTTLTTEEMVEEYGAGNFEFGMRGAPHVEGLHPRTFTVLKVDLVPDYDSNKEISEFDDYARAERGETFYWWVNDDGDPNGQDVGGTDIPISGNDFDDGVVDSTRDLIDFFPVFIDLHGLIEDIGTDDLQFHLEGAKVNYVEPNSQLVASFGKDEVGRFLTYPRVAKELVGAPTREATAGNPFSTGFEEEIKDERGTLYLEGRAIGEDPLALVCLYQGEELFRKRLPMTISLVEFMYIRKNIADAGGETILFSAADNNFVFGFPDSETNGRDFIFLHGYNVDQNPTRGWQAEMFKRFHQSGSRARFTGITWSGAQFRPSDGLRPPPYWNAVVNAFQTSPILEGALAHTNPANSTIAAHSLGNMVVSSAIVDHGYNPQTYLKINAAVPLEAYDPSANHLPYMRNRFWWDDSEADEQYEKRLYATEWHRLFSETDNRSKLTWNNRFGVIPQAYHFYSTGDEVLDNPDFFENPIDFSGSKSWFAQEFFKGTPPPGLNFGREHGGWGFNDAYDRIGTITTISSTEASMLSDEQLRMNTFFRPFEESDPEFPTYDGSVLTAPDLDPTASAEAGEYFTRNKLLGEAIPAASFSAGHNPLNSVLGAARNINMNSPSMKIGWPGERSDSDMRHSDLRDVSYVYIHRIFEKMVEVGNLK